MKIKEYVQLVSGIKNFLQAKPYGNVQILVQFGPFWFYVTTIRLKNKLCGQNRNINGTKVRFNVTAAVMLSAQANHGDKVLVPLCITHQSLCLKNMDHIPEYNIFVITFDIQNSS